MPADDNTDPIRARADHESPADHDHDTPRTHESDTTDESESDSSSLPPGPWTPTKRESESAYDGFLSTHAEWHAFSHGIYMGLTTAPWKTPPEPDNPDVRKESHYYRGGYVLGSVAQIVILVGFGKETFETLAFEALINGGL